MAIIERINHVAIVVEDLDAALRFWRDALGLDLTHVEEVASQESLVAFLPTGDSEIELVKPTTSTSGIARFLEKRGAGFHHLCLETPDLDATLAKLKGLGVRLINETPTIGAGGARMAFIHPSSAYGVLVELYESRHQAPPSFPTLETERLVLREFHPRDVEAVFNIFSRDEVTQNLQTPTLRTQSEAQHKLEQRINLARQGLGFRWALDSKDKAGLAIGSVGFYVSRRGMPTVEVGFEMHPDYWRQGYMSEALGAVISFAFSEACPIEVHRIEALTYLDNPASIGLLQKMGFQEEGILRELGYWKGAFHDLRCFSLLKPEWRTQAAR